MNKLMNDVTEDKMKWNLFNVSTLLFGPIIAMGFWAQNISHQAESNYRKIDELEKQMEEVLQRTDHMETKFQSGRERLEQLSYRQETLNH